ncbi:MAG: hypothetical protein GF388_07175 [Candidatus Aegiribacteria sp.]|nr:hypothetical protein [Candidatus Aegiribacteria sp.]MBD3294915.1 hypothetical protein [Candidatus Fermentibacteria bacterium]
MANFLEKLGNLDRRIIFVLIALAVIIPILTNLVIPNKVGQEPSRELFEYVDSLPDGSNVLVSFDYDPSTMPELQPMAEAVVRHIFMKEHTLVGMALWPQGATLGQAAMSAIADSLGKVQYEDWCNLGYKTGGGVMIVRLGTSMRAVFPTDRDNVPWSEIPMLQGINNLNDFDMIISLSAGDPGIIAWVMMAGDRYGVPIGGGCTAVSAPQLYTYLQTGQMVGLLGGLKGAADYETLVGLTEGRAVQGMSPQSVAHLAIMIFIIIGNVAYFAQKKRKGGVR